MLYGIIIIFFVILFFFSKRQMGSTFNSIDKKKHRLYFLYPMARFILIRAGLEEKCLKQSEVSKNIRALYVLEGHENQTRLYWYQKTSLVLLIIFIFSSLSFFISIESYMNKSVSFDNHLIRPEEEEGDNRIRLRYKIQNREDLKDFYEDEITIENKARIYSHKEWDELLNIAIPYLEKEMLGENEEASHVHRNLNFIKKIPKTGISIEWIPKDYKLIDSRGIIHNEDMVEDKVETLVTAILRYHDRKVEHIIPITIVPPIMDNKDILQRELESIIDETNEATAMDKKWSLPKKIGDYLVIWERDEKNISMPIFILGLTGAILIWFFCDKELNNKMKLRNNQLLLDYPEIINKFILLINAGMTIKQAWSKIAEDYRQKLNKGEINIRYAYEEMLVTLNELKLGIPEAKAYEQYGKRVALLPYMKFTSLIVQNLRKGNKGLADLLNNEAMEALHTRREISRRLGEEASTKLIGPMIIMLFIVLIIIMVPAIISIRM